MSDRDLCAACGNQFPAGQRCDACITLAQLVAVRCRTCQQVWIDWIGSDASQVDCRCLCDEPTKEQWAVSAVQPVEQALSQLEAARAQAAHCALKCSVCWAVGVTALETALVSIRAMQVILRSRRTSGGAPVVVSEQPGQPQHVGRGHEADALHAQESPAAHSPGVIYQMLVEVSPCCFQPWQPHRGSYQRCPGCGAPRPTTR